MIAGAIVAMMSSCLGDLDVKPIDDRITTAADVYKTNADYKAGLAKLYASFALTGQEGPFGSPDVGGVDEGFSNFIRSMWNMNELTTDEAIWTYLNDSNGTIGNLHTHSWVPSDGIPTAMYARIANVAVHCNEFIRATEAKIEDPEIRRFQAEARFLRALAYYHGIDLFGGRVPFVTEEDLPGAYFPEMTNRQDLFEYVESELLAIKEEMGEPRFEYGRADQAACAMLLSKLYLNAEVFVSTPMYNEALEQLTEVIGAGYSLNDEYLNNFLADNHESPEIIFAQLFDGRYSRSYDATNIMIFGNAGNGGWSGLRTTKAFVNKFTNPNEARALFAKEDKGQQLEINEIANEDHGYGIFKFRNVTSEGEEGTNSTFQDTDFPMFRLADAYLMYAEAILRTNGNKSDALTYVNAIRTRPGDVANGNAPGAITEAQLTLDFILDERARELYWEGHRRPDLIRFGKYVGSSYLWPWKGGVREGTAIEEKREVFPIPAADIGSNPNLEQDPRY